MFNERLKFKFECHRTPNSNDYYYFYYYSKNTYSLKNLKHSNITKTIICCTQYSFQQI